MAYVPIAWRAPPLISLLAALAAWNAAATLFRLFPPQPLVGIAVFAIVRVVARSLWPASKPVRADRLGLLCAASSPGSS
ncbi:hypothetical protein [Microvirga sp. VF16]|uniref:hypothetical protein n=1 Tax=Microvirga sp. VF16 TaxID=2807101 RepID=UPI00193CC77B|nr:hypothetical protein [Microvirga sp. VF16]QRM32779.1 hypothetical protein JO965_25725 [Microvirga sp. VF16]